MNIIDYDERILIPANKICNMFINKEDGKQLVLWLDGGQIQTLTFESEEQAKENYRTIKKVIKSL